jgi:TRAP transporter TAXI family solute receptor
MPSRRMQMNFIILSLIIALPLIIGSGATSVAAAAEKPTVVSILLCPLGCGPLEGDTILGGLIARKDPSMILRPQETPGYVYNIREMDMNKARWKTTVFATEDDIIGFGPYGGTKEFKEFLPQPITAKFKLLYGEAYWTQGHWWVTFDPSLKTVSDLKGKKLGLGLRTQSDWGLNARIDLEFGYGINPDNTKIYHLGPAKEVEEMLDGKVDAVVMGMGTEPFFKEWLIAGPMRNLEASGRKLYYIGMEPEVIEKLNKRFNTSYITVEVPPNTLPNQPESFTTAADRGYKAVHESFSEETAYKFVMAVATYGPEMKGLHGLWRIWSPELMVGGLTEENTHPGAIKAFKELGWWDLRKKFKPVQLPN